MGLGTLEIFFSIFSCLTMVHLYLSLSPSIEAKFWKCHCVLNSLQYTYRESIYIYIRIYNRFWKLTNVRKATSARTFWSVAEKPLTWRYPVWYLLVRGGLQRPTLNCWAVTTGNSCGLKLLHFAEPILHCGTAGTQLQRSLRCIWQQPAGKCRGMTPL